ncbi:glycosyl hydrolase family 65 protein, partial [Streptacidiphilus monticola]
AAALCWRRNILPAARERAAQLGLRGAAFPWRTIAGRECSGYWPAGTAAFHVNADVADAVARYLHATGDEAFGRGTGLELAVETARLWRSLGHHGHDGRFHIDGVTGPDEYSALADDNLYTNLMAQANLRLAADLADRFPAEAEALGVDDEETAAWRDAADAVNLPFNPRLGVHEQAAGFTGHQRWDFAATGPECYPLLLHFPYVDLYRKQVVKQADLALALYLRGEAFSEEQKAADFSYYEELTVRDSSLSAAVQAVVAAELGHLRLAYDYLAEAALIDLDDLQHNSRDGLHLASLAGAWTALVAGLGGFRLGPGAPAFAPRLPPELSSLCFRLRLRGRTLRVRAVQGSAEYLVQEGGSLTVRHFGEELRLEPGRPETRPVPPAPARPEPVQPQGRRPARRGGPLPDGSWDGDGSADRFTGPEQGKAARDRGIRAGERKGTR